jgi:zinc protease
MGKSTAAQMAGALLMRGTKEKNRQQIQDEADRLKARINIGGSPTGANLSIETVGAGIAGSLKLAAECLRESTLLDSEFEEARQLHIAQIEYGRQEPTMLANIEMQHHLNPYPRGDVRYVGTPDEQIDDLKKVTPAEARQFYSQFYGASDSELVITGQFDPAEMKKLTADLFGNWKSPSPYVRVSTSYHKVDSIDRKIETPDKQNAFFMAALTARMSDDDPDYPAMVLADYILGGSGASRLFKRIRDKEGLSYGVRSNFSAPSKDDGATFMSTAISNPQNAPKVEASFKDEVARTVKDGFTAQEVEEARKSLLEERMVGRSQDQSLAGMLAQRERWGRTMKWDEAFEARIAALTPDQVSAAFRRYIDPAALSIVKAGDFKKAGVFQ